MAVTHLGITIDYSGIKLDELPKEAVAEVLRAYPRLEMKKKLRQALCCVVERKPHAAFANFLEDFGQRYVPGFTAVDLCDVLEGAPFDG